MIYLFTSVAIDENIESGGKDEVNSIRGFIHEMCGHASAILFARTERLFISATEAVLKHLSRHNEPYNGITDL